MHEELTLTIKVRFGNTMSLIATEAAENAAKELIRDAARRYYLHDARFEIKPVIEGGENNAT